MPTPDKILLRDLDSLAAEFKTKLANVLNNLSTQMDGQELAKLIAQLNFFKELQSEGLDLHLAKFFTSYHEQIQTLLDIAKDEKVSSALAVNANVLDLIKEVDAKTLLGKAADFSNLLQRQLLQGLVNGKSNADIIKSLEGVNLTTAQMNTVVSTAYNDFGRAVTAQAYQDSPDQKFLYGNGREIDNPTIRDTCKHALILQAEQYPEGVTMQEILEGVYPEIDLIQGGGPNCSHSFFPASQFAIELEKRRMKKAEENLKKENE